MLSASASAPVAAGAAAVLAPVAAALPAGAVSLPAGAVPVPSASLQQARRRVQLFKFLATVDRAHGASGRGPAFCAPVSSKICPSGPRAGRGECARTGAGVLARQGRQPMRRPRRVRRQASGPHAVPYPRPRLQFASCARRGPVGRRARGRGWARDGPGRTPRPSRPNGRGPGKP